MSTISQPENTPTRSLENFRGDFDAIGLLMKQSWGKNDKQALLYTKEFLQSCFEYPQASHGFAPTIYHGTAPIAFVAGFPRRVRYKERELNILLITFLTVAPEYKKSGYGVVVWSELVKRARASGFDGMVNYCVEGEAMNRMIVGCCRRLGLQAERIYSVHYLSCILFPKSEDVSAAAESMAIDTLMEIGNPVGDLVPLARIWTREEAAWQCNRPGAVIAITVHGARSGMITGYIMPAADGKETKCLLVEDVLWGNLEAEEREALVRQLKTKAAAAGARVATLPVLGYAGTDPFKASRFRPSQRILHAYLTVWSDAPALHELSSFYLDVF